LSCRGYFLFRHRLCFTLHLGCKKRLPSPIKKYHGDFYP
jgi:hypothetical protein